MTGACAKIEHVRTTRRLLCFLLSLPLINPVPAIGQTGSVELAQGIRQVDEGDLDAALITLDGAVHRLTGVKGRGAELALAHLYLGIAYLGVGQWERAKTEMREAWRNDKGMKLDPKKFPLRVIQAYEEAKNEASPPGKTPAPAASSGKGGGSSKALLIVGGLAAAAGGVALAGGSSAPTPAAVSRPQVLVVGSSQVSAPGVTTRFSAFTVPSAGLIQYTGNWTVGGNAFSLELGQNCGGFGPYVAETPPTTARPLTLTHRASASDTYCPYALYVSGSGSESFSYQIVFTPQ